MARFGRDFVRAATQPAYLEGLFSAAKDISGLPARAAAAQQQASLQKGLFGLEQMALSGDLTPEMYKEAVGSYTQLMKQNPAQADEIRKSLASVGASVREQDKTRSKIQANNSLSDIQTRMTALYSDPTIDSAEQEEEAAKLRLEFETVKEENPDIDFSSFTNWDVRSQNAGITIASRIKEQEDDVERERIRSNLSTRSIDERTKYIQEEYNGPLSDYAVTIANSLNAFDERVKAREEEATNRKQNFNSSIENLEESLEKLPVGLKQELTKELNDVRQLQTTGIRNGVWITTRLQQVALEKLNGIDARIESFKDRRYVADERSVRDAEIKISALSSQINNPPENSAELGRLARLAAIEGGENRAFKDLSGAKQQEYLKRARQKQLENHNNAINRDISVNRAIINAIKGDEESSEDSYSAYDVEITEAMAEYPGKTRTEIIAALQRAKIIPTDSSGTVSEEVIEAPQLSEEEALSIWFGKEGEGFDLIESVKESVQGSLSKAAVNTRVYKKFTDGSGGDLRGVSTSDLEMVVNDNNKFTPRIKAELVRRRAQNG